MNIKTYNFNKICSALEEYFKYEFEDDECVDLSSSTDDFELFKRTGKISLYYTECNDSIFELTTYLDLADRQVYYEATTGDGTDLWKKEVLFNFSDEDELLEIISHFCEETLVEYDQEELAEITGLLEVA